MWCSDRQRHTGTYSVWHWPNPRQTPLVVRNIWNRAGSKILKHEKVESNHEVAEGIPSEEDSRSLRGQVYGGIRRSSASPRPLCDGILIRPPSGHRSGRRQARHARIPQIWLHLTQPWSVWTPPRRWEFVLFQIGCIISSHSGAGKFWQVSGQRNIFLNF